MQKTRYWHKLDNAAKVFPAVSKKARSNVFRLSFYLTSDINPDILEESVNLTLKRFQVFNIQLKNGIFWNYFSENKKTFKVEEEPSQVCKFFKFNKNNGYLFKVYYLKNKITLETFHSLTDGTGAINFLKSITYKYLKLMGHYFDHESLILSEMPFSNKENEDSFGANYNPKIKKNLKEEKAYHLKGDVFKDYWSLVFKIRINTKDFLTVIKEKYKCTVTEYVSALIAYGIYDEGIDVKNSKKPIKMFIPVNLRPLFNSTSLRNFSLYIKSTFELSKEWTFEEMIEHTKLEFKDQIVKEKIHMRLGALVSLEKNPFVRFVPLFIKNVFFRVGYYLLGESINTSSLSNMGIVSLPSEMKQYIKDVDFINSGKGINTTIVSYGEHTNITFNSIIKDVSVIKTFVYQLRSDNIEVIVDTNYEEGYDEIL
ncbi:condensation domain-containing protein [Haploplasma axanthum]|uniref:Alcohol acetyltransferase n=1 Tax=Haploplasma axanthum TaxID=29552 RepID=A0A449BF00_HAPAX|nr:hypothetical protein [Haploplasma axanthum]VEU80880.1 Uncharacterised protein [Haploplasma axanthum]